MIRFHKQELHCRQIRLGQDIKVSNYVVGTDTITGKHAIHGVSSFAALSGQVFSIAINSA